MTTHRRLLALALASLFPIALAGCPKKDPPPVPDSAPVPTATQAETVLVPLEEDAGDQVDAADAAKPKWTGPSLSTNQIRAKQCCGALRAQQKAMGASPEAMQLAPALIMCDQAAMSLGPTTGAQSPEFAGLRAMLQGKTIPPMCQGL